MKGVAPILVAKSAFALAKGQRLEGEPEKNAPGSSQPAAAESFLGEP